MNAPQKSQIDILKLRKILEEKENRLIYIIEKESEEGNSTYYYDTYYQAIAWVKNLIDGI